MDKLYFRHKSKMETVYIKIKNFKLKNDEDEGVMEKAYKLYYNLLN